jgi:hypothetical protein
MPQSFIVQYLLSSAVVLCFVSRWVVVARNCLVNHAYYLNEYLGSDDEAAYVQLHNALQP